MISPTGAQHETVRPQRLAGLQREIISLDRVNRVSEHGQVGIVQCWPEIGERDDTQAGISPENTGSSVNEPK